MSEDVVIVSGVRTADRAFRRLVHANTPASDLGRRRHPRGRQPAPASSRGQVDQVILGCVGQVAEDAYISRHAGLKAGLPIDTPAYTVNRFCGSGLEAINTAARWIQTGDAEIVVAGGAENMTMHAVLRAQGRYGYRLGNGVLEDGILHLLPDPFEDVPHGHHGREPGREVRGLARGTGRVRPAQPPARPSPPIDAGSLQGADRAGRGEGRAARR